MNLILSVLIMLAFVTSAFSHGKQNVVEPELITEEKLFSGPMGIGLRKSYLLGKNKICIYSTIKGQRTVTLKDNLSNCPLIFPQ